MFWKSAYFLLTLKNKVLYKSQYYTFKKIGDFYVMNFVSKDSIVRQIWGKTDTILFIFAGAAAEFSLNKAVDWLYYTGKLPKDPLGRLFSTVAYAPENSFFYIGSGSCSYRSDYTDS